MVTIPTMGLFIQRRIDTSLLYYICRPKAHYAKPDINLLPLATYTLYVQFNQITFQVNMKLQMLRDLKICGPLPPIYFKTNL